MPAYPAENISQAGSSSETPASSRWDRIQRSPTYAHPNGPTIEDYTAGSVVPPTLTPATTTCQPVALQVLSTLWDDSNVSMIDTERRVPADPSIPSIVARAPSPSIQETPSDLTTSASSIPSTTTTLTNTLPPTQSAALRALNAPAFQNHPSTNANSKPAKSTSSQTTLSSQPVVVRTYSGARHISRASSGVNSPRLFPNLSSSMPPPASMLTAGLAGRSERLPAADDFSFSAILRAVDPEIREAIDAIAEICAKSRLSLADEYDAHLPPQGEITAMGTGWASSMGAMAGRGRLPRIGQAWNAGEQTLTVVPEASSSSERLVSEHHQSATADPNKKRNQSAYGSLKSVISGGSGKRRALDLNVFGSTERDVSKENTQSTQTGPAWSVRASPAAANHPSLTIVTSSQASKQLSLDCSSTIKNVPEGPQEQETQQTQTKATALDTKYVPSHRRNASSISNAQSRVRSSTLSSLTSWIPWSRNPDAEDMDKDATKAVAKLREMLVQSETSNLGKGKAPAHAV
ncbi:hypothetical protein BU24DRAFT_457170 [Aaosphaeria arxii CBS 175.79]|uniref:Uncharacterized protein n=1 Tax=Aaosphaeria arxii CBS 175.79 TaxID=1450172 RepID=A0A6A5Y7A4_9PLEO|nr:uncharacterized protein BU24DRAFT_457170 [Aaosphaeria arxii CBS 175.79]KAF2021166.1 hypothetical protein BU24DRAFT_457170 [Aaosphaeria arxii CBS 175.79]